MRGKKRPTKRTAYIPPNPGEKIARGDRCVYCGKAVTLDEPPFLAAAHTREFPVCSAACKAGAELYVAQDKKTKIVFYIWIFLCSMGVLASALTGSMPQLMNATTLLAGVGFIALPYPIISFETFLGCPIQRVRLICRCIGTLLVVLGTIFIIATLQGG